MVYLAYKKTCLNSIRKLFWLSSWRFEVCCWQARCPSWQQ